MGVDIIFVRSIMIKCTGKLILITLGENFILHNPV